MAKFLDQNGSKRLVDNFKTSRSALNTKINSEIVARENLATDVKSSISALDTKIDGLNSYTAGDNITISDGKISAKDTTYSVATTSTSGLMSSSDKAKLNGIAAGAQINNIEEFWVDGVKQSVTDKKVSLDLSGKVDKVSDKQLSTEDFTTAEKTKLAGIENGAEANVIGSIKVDGTALTVTNKAVNINLSGKVDTVSGKQLSTNDFTTAEKNKLAGIDTGAQVNAIEEIFIDGTKQSVTDKKASLDLSNYAKKTDIFGVYRYKGSVNTFSDLPTTAETGDVYNIKTAGGSDVFGTSIKAGDNVAFNGTGWDVLSGTVDLSGYVEKVSGKQLSTEDFTTAEKTKLAGIATNANNYTLPTATSSTLGGVKIGSGISVSSGKISVPTVTSSANGLMSSTDKKKLDSLASITSAGDNITISGGTIKAADTTYSVATTSTSGLMSSTDKAKLDGLSVYTAGDNITISGGKISGTAPYTLPAATTSSLGGIKVGTGLTVTNGTVSLASATALNFGGVKVGSGISVSGGIISVPNATTSQAGIVKVGSGISVSSGTISVPTATSSANGLMSSADKTKLDGLSNYELPTASTSTKGGVKIGNGLSMDGDTLNVTVTGVDDLDTWNAANLYLKPAVLGSASSTVNGAIWFVSDSETTSGSSDIVIFGTTASALDGAVWFA